MVRDRNFIRITTSLLFKGLYLVVQPFGFIHLYYIFFIQKTSDTAPLQISILLLFGCLFAIFCCFSFLISELETRWGRWGKFKSIILGKIVLLKSFFATREVPSHSHTTCLKGKKNKPNPLHFRILQPQLLGFLILTYYISLCLYWADAKWTV